MGKGFPWWSSGKNLPSNAGDVGSLCGQGTKILHDMGNYAHTLQQEKSACAVTKTQHRKKIFFFLISSIIILGLQDPG